MTGHVCASCSWLGLHGGRCHGHDVVRSSSRGGGHGGDNDGHNDGHNGGDDSVGDGDGGVGGGDDGGGDGGNGDGRGDRVVVTCIIPLLWSSVTVSAVVSSNSGVGFATFKSTSPKTVAVTATSTARRAFLEEQHAQEVARRDAEARRAADRRRALAGRGAGDDEDDEDDDAEDDADGT